MSRKTEVIIAIAIILALVIVLFVLWRDPKQAVNVVTETQNNNGAQVEIPVVPAEDIPEQNEVSATTVARVFVERFGSYSTESGYENLDDVLALSTTSVQTRLNKLADTAREQEDQAYYGVSTRIISVKTEESSETEAKLLITTQRQESFDSPGNTSVRYQDIRLSLVKEGEDWLVGDFIWVEE